jgi:hypothetical protein
MVPDRAQFRNGLVASENGNWQTSPESEWMGRGQPILQWVGNFSADTMPGFDPTVKLNFSDGRLLPGSFFRELHFAKPAMHS